MSSDNSNNQDKPNNETKKVKATTIEGEARVVNEENENSENENSAGDDNSTINSDENKLKVMMGNINKDNLFENKWMLTAAVSTLVGIFTLIILIYHLYNDTPQIDMKLFDKLEGKIVELELKLSESGKQLTSNAISIDELRELNNQNDTGKLTISIEALKEKIAISESKDLEIEQRTKDIEEKITSISMKSNQLEILDDYAASIDELEAQIVKIEEEGQSIIRMVTGSNDKLKAQIVENTNQLIASHLAEKNSKINKIIQDQKELDALIFESDNSQMGSGGFDVSKLNIIKKELEQKITNNEASINELIDSSESFAGSYINIQKISKDNDQKLNDLMDDYNQRINQISDELTKLNEVLIETANNLADTKEELSGAIVSNNTNLTQVISADKEELSNIIANNSVGFTKELSAGKEVVSKNIEKTNLNEGKLLVHDGKLQEYAANLDVLNKSYEIVAGNIGDYNFERFDNIDDRLKNIEQSKSSIPEITRNASLALILASFNDAVKSGKAYSLELEALKQNIPDSVKLGVIESYATIGLSTNDELRADFTPLIDKIIKATLPQGVGIWSKLINNAKNVVTIRKVGNIEGDGLDAVLARIEYYLNQNNLEKALKETQNLPDEGKVVASDWLLELGARIEADNIISKLRTNILKTLTNG